ncbi:MAG: helix-turn-helix transcriptional regulator [Candidatus Eremiobacteraeota bacterium]|nr:helix-turn-helix transcriptional regulator [Candidatus Eremiobacteraeota bacterium]
MSMQRCCAPAAVRRRDREGEAGLFRTLADPHRLAILETLAAAEEHVCVCDFTAGLPLNQPTVSHHLRLLREAGLIESERRGTWVYYRLAPDARARMQAALDVVFDDLAVDETHEANTECCTVPSR